MVVEKTRHKASSLINKSFNWVHGNPTESSEINTLMMQEVPILKEIVSDVRNSCCVPWVHSPMNKVEVTISPTWHKKHPCTKYPECCFGLENIHEVVCNCSVCIQMETNNLKKCPHKCCGYTIWNLPHYLVYSRTLIVISKWFDF